MQRTGPTRPRLALTAGLALALFAVAACGGGEEPSGGDHTPVSVPPSSTAGPTPEPSVTLSGTGSDQVASAGFGMHMAQIADSTWPKIPIGAVRIINADSTWGALEPTKGSWDFARLDQRVAQAEERHASVLLVLSHPPTWAATRPDLHAFGGSPSPPTSDEDWKTYVRTVVDRYAGRIEAYEVWNEPNLTQFFVGTPQRLGALTDLAAAEIHAGDPDALVVSAGFSARTGGSQPYFQAYVGAMSPDSVDVVGIHIYPYPGDGPESMVAMTGQFRTLADNAGFAGKPMWNTEIGYGRTPDSVFSGDTAASLILRTYLVLPANGLARNYWYMWDDRKFVGLYLVEADRATETPAAKAYAEAERWLSGVSILGCGDRGGGLWTCELMKEGSVVTVAWKLGGTGSFTVPAGTTIAYPFTRDPAPAQAGATVEIGELPVLYSPVEIPSLVG